MIAAQELVLEVLQALMSDTKIVKESIQKGGKKVHVYNMTRGHLSLTSIVIEISVLSYCTCLTYWPLPGVQDIVTMANESLVKVLSGF